MLEDEDGVIEELTFTLPEKGEEQASSLNEGSSTQENKAIQVHYASSES